MLTKKMEKSINQQINREIFSAYLYLGMASFAQSEGLKGIANWFNVQVQEELSHAQLMYNYVNQQGGRVILGAIETPEQNFKLPLDLFKKTLAHEKIVTGLINDLVDIAKNEKDHATEIFLQWFVTEQVEEESNATDIIQKFKLMGSEGNSLFMIDTELGTRVFTPPVIK
ncbi:MAG: ferritin [Candidatus Omnitrophota bacterium]